MTGNIAANFLDNAFFQLFIKALRPAYKLPARNGKYPNVLIPAEFGRVQQAVNKATASADFLALESDGWSDISGRRLINVIVNTPKPYLYSTINATLEEHTGQYICDLLAIEIEKLGKLLELNILIENYRASKNSCSSHRQCQKHEEGLEIAE